MTAPATVLSDLRAGRLQGATRVDLRDAGLTELPPEILDLADTLEFLDVSGNALTRLPARFERLQALRTLFCSGNPFETLPEVLGECGRLDIVGFKANRIERVPAASIAASLRWLILSDNRITALPETLGNCGGLQKLALAGNRLAVLPASIARCERLELLRLSANRFATVDDALPSGLLALPNLAWLAYAGNPFNADQETHALRATPIAHISWHELQVGELLGQGASGHIHAARWQPRQGAERRAALKLFKGTMTSDGLPGSEMAGCIAAGVHANLIGVEGRLAHHPLDAQGLVMSLIPPHYRTLAEPPSFASCTRDVYAPHLRFSAAQAHAIARGAGDALAHLHARGLVHGDFYAHNLLVDDRSHALLGDFGAASFLPEDDAVRAEALTRIDRRALRVLVDELAQRCDEPAALDDLRPAD